MRLISTLMAGATIILTQTACGGGSSGTTTPTSPTIPASNNAPIVASENPDQTAIVGTSFSYDAAQAGATFSDADGDTLSYTVTFSPDTL